MKQYLLIALVTIGVCDQLHAERLSFFPKISYSANAKPYSVAIGDFNRDGKPDIVSVGFNNDVGVFKIFLGKGDGSFSQSSTIQTENISPISVAIEDFNHDGILDIVSGGPLSFSRNYLPGVLAVFLGNGKGGFLPETDYSVSYYPTSIAIGDFNHDGNPDLVVVNPDHDYLSILLGNGKGGFLPEADYTVLGSNSVAIGDLNRDGNPDLVTANLNNKGLSVLLSDGDGGYIPKGKYLTGNNGAAVAISDLNHDGQLDLFASINNGLVALLGNGKGGFRLKLSYGLDNRPNSVVIADLNRDGNPDLVASTYGNDNNLSILLGKGNGEFQDKMNYSVGSFPQSIAIGDLNHDAKLDLVTANTGSNNISILINNSH
ncbi:FG-GAP repeat domain-containing protein [Methylocucumis oryzae]|uniref:VCBS repeat-containing protein n=1 Tax=Methylocucumis oryzae TaxID=1632867 RepID=A0A0F3IGI9_9GAMM|nr:VCBS repeat-containing protein [Methylocucumis oryzae]KJV05920.1 hypothetical protein VZ94_14680 [Methylocucumis oryzae]